METIQIPIVYNQYGDYDPNGLLYVLEQDSKRIQKKALLRFQQSPPQPYEEVQPLVLRVNLGDTVKICFRNWLRRRLSIHVQGLGYDVMTSDGTSTGINQDSTTNGEIEYTWYAKTEGMFLFPDMADSRSGEESANIHGLFGAIIVEPSGAKWYENFAKRGIPMGSRRSLRRREQKHVGNMYCSFKMESTYACIQGICR